MQQLARDGLSADEVRTIITSDAPAVAWGVDVLRLDGTVDDALTASTDFVTCKVARNNDATAAAGVVDLTIGQELDWPNVRVRPWQSLDGVRFDLGVYGLQRPDSNPSTGQFQVQGADLLSELLGIIGDNRFDASGSDAIAAINSAITASGVTGVPVLIQADGTLTLAADFVSVLDVSSPDTWLDYINGLIGMINYRNLWANESGQFRSAPNVPLDQRPSEWDFDLTDVKTNIVMPDRTRSVDGLTPTNWWRFIRNGLATRPADGAGQVTIDLSGGGRQFRSVFAYDAASQATLELLAARRVALDQARKTRIQFTTGPLPCLGADDVVSVTDPDLSLVAARCRVVEYAEQLDTATCPITVEVL